MDDARKAEFRALGDEVDGLMEEVEAAYEDLTPHSVKLETRIKVESASERFRELIASTDPADPERGEIERRLGRKVTDLHRFANKLPAPPLGKKAEDRAKNEFFGTREGKSSNKPFSPGLKTGEARREGHKHSVGADTDAWCGPCDDIKTHTIVAMMGSEPAQVVCRLCGSKHKFRLGPARGRKDVADSAAPRSSSAPPPGAAKLDEKNAFMNELRTAPTVRPFVPRERYKAGEIIEHPEMGRGKVETSFPNSLLVRFSTGLRPVKLG
jgi:hypothetical protein